MNPETLAAFMALERSWGPLLVTSGFRCELHNQAVGGARNSQHLVGKAIDVLCEPTKADALVAAAKVAGFRGIGHGVGFLHVDTRACAAEWHY
jgi:uncharacterized protein YcbK (DUF882 family)